MNTSTGINSHYTRVALTLFMIILVQGYLAYNLTLMAIASLFMVAFTLAFRRDILRTRLTTNRLIMLIVIPTMTLTLPFALYKNVAAPLHYGIGVLSIIAAYVISKFPIEACQGVGITLFAFQSVTLIYLFTTDISVLPLDHMFEASSSNGITSVLVVLQAVYAGLRFKIYRKASVISSLLTLYICIAGFSRGSILAGAMICLVVLAGSIHFTKSYRWRIAVYLTLLILVAILYYQYSDALLSLIQLETKFAQGFEDSHRDQIYRDYLGKIDWITFFTGADFSNTSIQNEYNNNPHSSLIRAHYLFGVLYIIALFFATFFGVFATKVNGGFFLLTAFIFIILARSLSEPILFPTPLDFFFFLLIFVGNSSPKNIPLYSCAFAY